MNEPIDLQRLYECRMLVFLESDDGEFHQVLLNKKQFKKISDIISEVEKQDGVMQGVTVRIKEDWSIPSDTFIGLESISEEE